MEDLVSAIRTTYGRLVPLAHRGLREMVDESTGAFCQSAHQGRSSSLQLKGESIRYSAMSLVGLARQLTLGRPAGVVITPIADRLHRFAPDAEVLGDAGLILWSEVARGEKSAAAQTTEAILRRKSEILSTDHGLPSMETGFLLIGLAEAIRAGNTDSLLTDFAMDVAAALATNQDPGTDLFSFGRKVRRKNVHRARTDARLGSFASQVYPIMGFASLFRATGDEQARAIALACADRLCELQGPQGQWWWIYHVRTGKSAMRYPVYSVHQDAMGPMALLAAAMADGNTERYDEAILKSLNWFDDRPECSAVQLIDPELSAIWRAVQHDDPLTTGRLGLSKRELTRMGRAAWFGTEDTREFKIGAVCRECRPYHLGWVLLAGAMFEECLTARS